MGRATASQLASKGCSVLIKYRRSHQEAEETAQACQKSGVWAEPFQADISHEEDCLAMVKRVEEKFRKKLSKSSPSYKNTSIRLAKFKLEQVI